MSDITSLYSLLGLIWLFNCVLWLRKVLWEGMENLLSSITAMGECLIFAWNQNIKYILGMVSAVLQIEKVDMYRNCYMCRATPLFKYQI